VRKAVSTDINKRSMPSCWMGDEALGALEAWIEGVFMRKAYRKGPQTGQRCIKPRLLAMDIKMPKPKPSDTMAVPP
jgi:hypothetical protein